MAIEFLNDMNRDDYRELLYFNLLHRKKWFKYVFALMVVFSGAVVLAAVFGIIEQGYFFYMALLSLVMVLVLYFQIESVSKRFEKNAEFKKGFCRTFTVDDEGVKSPINDGSMGCVPWTSFTEGYETSTVFLFYIGARQAITLVKHSMSPSQIDALRKLAQEKLQARFDMRLKKA